MRRTRPNGTGRVLPGEAGSRSFHELLQSFKPYATTHETRVPRWRPPDGLFHRRPPMKQRPAERKTGLFRDPNGQWVLISHLPAGLRGISQERQDRRYAPVLGGFWAEPELGEDGADVLFDGGFGEHEGGGDAGVGPSAGHLAQDVEFSRGEPAQG